MKVVLLKLLTLLFLCMSCSSKEEGTISKEFLWMDAQKADPRIQMIIPKDINSGLKCADYGVGCKGGFMASHQGVVFYFIEFENAKMAKDEAERIDAFFYKNWVFDDVADEPVLEAYIKKAFNAVRPLKEKK